MVIPPPSRTTPIVSWTTPSAIIYGTALSATQLNATANVPGVFSYSPTLGTVLNAGAQKLSVTFTPTDSLDYSSASDSVMLSVNQTASVLSWTAPAAISYGTALSAAQLNATANVPGVFSYSPTLGTVLNAGAQKLSVTFTPNDITDYTSASDNVTLIVNQTVPSIGWIAPAAITYGTALSATQLNATSTVAGKFNYSPATGTVLSAGSQTLSATFTPTDTADYTTNSDSVTLIVNPATPRIAWTPTGAIAVGMPLTSTQLDATAKTPGGAALAGSFQYSPSAGSILNTSGSQTLSVVFTPTDVEDYAIADANTALTVLPFGIAAWGDSFTQGGQGGQDRGVYPTDLQALVVLPVLNMGIGGQTSTQIGVREGGVPTYATVAGGMIPATSGVTVTFPAGFEPVTSSGPLQGTSGTILGIHGTVTIDATGTIYTFTPSLPGSAVSAPGAPRFVVDTPYNGYLPIFWEGGNNTSDPPQILSDIAAQVATVPSGQNYLVLSILNLNIASAWIGGSVYDTIVGINNQLASTYGAHYMDIRKLLVDSYNPALITDCSDYQHDELPTSLRAFSGSGTLAQDISPTDTTFNVNFTVGGAYLYRILTIDTGENAENVEISSINGSTMTVIRNFGGLNTSHLAGAPVTETDYVHLNAQGYQIVANNVAHYLSAYSK